MNAGARIRTVILFIVKFAILAPVCLIVWWQAVVPYYAEMLGQICGVVLVYAMDAPIQALQVTSDGILDTRTFLVYITKTGRLEIEIGRFINNLPPYVILVLATPSLGFRRRMKVLGVGSGLLVVVHIVFLVGAFAFSDRIQSSTEIFTAVGKFLLTLSFILWIALAYWDKLSLLLDGEPQEDKSITQENR